MRGIVCDEMVLDIQQALVGTDYRHRCVCGRGGCRERHGTHDRALHSMPCLTDCVIDQGSHTEQFGQ